MAVGRESPWWLEWVSAHCHPTCLFIDVLSSYTFRVFPSYFHTWNPHAVCNSLAFWQFCPTTSITGSRCLSLAHRAVARPRCYAKWRVCTTRSFSIAWSSWTPPVEIAGWLGCWSWLWGFWRWQRHGKKFDLSSIMFIVRFGDAWLMFVFILVGRRMMNKLREFWNRDVTERNGKISNKQRWYHRQQSEWQQQCRILLS